MLGSSPTPLATGYDLAMLDLDGVVYVDGHAVPGAPEYLARAREAGMRLAFITNNASRSPVVVGDHLVQLGIPATAQDVVTSAQAAARIVCDRLGPGRPVVVLGAEGLHEAVREVGLVAVGVEDEADALVTGYGPDVIWREVMRAAVRVRDGLWWVASNSDMSFPTSFGPAPGHGVMVEMLSRFTGVVPIVAGKPSTPLLEETVRRVGGAHPLMVGDRLDTDIAGGAAAGVDTLLVMTGVTGLPELAETPPALRPTYLAPDLVGLLETHESPVLVGGGAAGGGWLAEVVAGRLEVRGEGGVSPWWQTVAAALWRHLDVTGVPADVSTVAPPPSAAGVG